MPSPLGPQSGQVFVKYLGPYVAPVQPEAPVPGEVVEAQRIELGPLRLELRAQALFQRCQELHLGRDRHDFVVKLSFGACFLRLGQFLCRLQFFLMPGLLCGLGRFFQGFFDLVRSVASQDLEFLVHAGDE